MSKRVAAAFLWFIVGWVGYEIAWSLAGVPRLLGPVIAAALASFVAVDPMGLFWPRVTAPVQTSSLAVSPQS